MTTQQNKLVTVYINDIFIEMSFSTLLKLIKDDAFNKNTSIEYFEELEEIIVWKWTGNKTFPIFKQV